MPIFTVIVKDARTNRTKEVTVNTDGMVATVVDDEKEEYMRQQQQGLPVSATTTATPVVASKVSPAAEPAATDEAAVEADTGGIHLDIPGNGGRGGKRSAPSFRLKKRRVTRKFKKSSK